uniref:Transcriptional regulator, MarR family n=1 Tax=Parastrongyloides trichosuri TaxID=131310 RepID=A0A0N4ZJE6_PARTI
VRRSGGPFGRPEDDRRRLDGLGRGGSLGLLHRRGLGGVQGAGGGPGPARHAGSSDPQGTRHRQRPEMHPARHLGRHSGQGRGAGERRRRSRAQAGPRRAVLPAERQRRGHHFAATAPGVASGCGLMFGPTALRAA